MANCRIPLEERLWSNVKRGASDECWIWTGRVDAGGYGTIKDKGKPEGVHRVSYRLAYGDIPAGMVIRHACDNPSCVNPAHLTTGTVQQNMADRVARGRSLKGMAKGSKVRDIKHEPRKYATSLRGAVICHTAVDDNGCWNWTGGITKTGYGILYVGDTYHLAHRLAYGEFVGPIPDGLFILHRCDNRACVNPDHLRAGTHADNMADMKERQRYKLPPKTARARGERNQNAKLSVEAVRDILSSELTKAALAEKYGVDKRTVQSVRARKSWRHVA